METPLVTAYFFQIVHIHMIVKYILKDDVKELIIVWMCTEIHNIPPPPSFFSLCLPQYWWPNHLYYLVPCQLVSSKPMSDSNSTLVLKVEVLKQFKSSHHLHQHISNAQNYHMHSISILVVWQNWNYDDYFGLWFVYWLYEEWLIWIAHLEI